MELTTLIIFGVLFILAYFLVVIPFMNVVKFRGIPSHEAIPVLGNVVEMWKCHKEFNKLFERWVSKYGRGPAVIWASYWFPIVVLGDANDVKKVLSSKQHVQKGMLYRALDEVIGSGAFNSPVDIWRQRRPYLEQAFHSRVLQELPVIFDRSSRCLLKALGKDGKNTGSIFDIHPYLNLCSIQMLVGGALGLDIDPFEGSDFWEIAVEKYNIGTYFAEYRMLRPWFLLSNALWELTPYSREMRKSVEWLHEKLFAQFLTTKKIMDSRQNNNFLENSDLNYGNPTTDKDRNHKNSRNFLDLLLHLQISNRELKLSDQELIYEIASIYIAGTDASGKTMSFLILFLALHQECQDKVRAELDTIFGSDDNGNRPVTESDCKKLIYLECCIKETLRLMPPVSFITRRVGSDIQLDNGGWIPVGTEVAISTYAVHRNPEVYPEPDAFKPERFLPQEQDNSKKPIGCYDWIPFSSGARNCLGPKFAMMEIKVVVANILRHHRVTSSQLRGDMKNWILHTNITLNLSGGWNVALLPKNRACKS